MSKQVLDSIPNETAKQYMAGEIAKVTSFMVDTALVDLCKGNWSQAIILSRIVYWHRPNSKNGESKLRVEKDGHLWLAKHHGDWYSECRIPESTVRRVIKNLECKNLIVVKRSGFKGLRTTLIRLNWEAFGQQLAIWMTPDEPENDNQDNSQTLKVSERERSEWTFEGSLSAHIGRLDCLTTTSQTLSLNGSNAQSEQVKRSEWTGQTLKVSSSNTVSTTGSTTISTTKEKRIKALSPVGDKPESEKSESEVSEIVEAEIVAETQDDVPEAEVVEEIISEDEWIETKSAQVKAIAFAFNLKEEFGGFNGRLRTQLDGTAKKGKRKEFALDEPATASEMWGFGSWYKEREIRIPTTAETIYERFEEFRSLQRYERYRRIGEEHLRLAYRKLHVPEPEVVEVTPEMKAQVEAAFRIDEFKEVHRKRYYPANKAEWLAARGKDINNVPSTPR